MHLILILADNLYRTSIDKFRFSLDAPRTNYSQSLLNIYIYYGEKEISSRDLIHLCFYYIYICDIFLLDNSLDQKVIDGEKKRAKYIVAFQFKSPRCTDGIGSFIAKQICETIGNFRAVATRVSPKSFVLAMTRERGLETFAGPLSQRSDNIQAEPSLEDFNGLPNCAISIQNISY